VAVLHCKEMARCKDRGDLMSLSDAEITLLEDVRNCLKPLKDITTMLCSEKAPTASLIRPLLSQV